MTAIDLLARHIGLRAMVAPIAVLVAISNIGAASAYLSATARLPFVAGVHRYLPAVFGRVHPRFSTPWVALISYGAAGILFGLLGQAGTSVKGAYDMLVAWGSSPTSFLIYFCLLQWSACSPNRRRPGRSVCPAANGLLLRSRASGFYLPHARSFCRSFLQRMMRIPPDHIQGRDNDSCAAGCRCCNLSLKPPRAPTPISPVDERIRRSTFRLAERNNQ